MLTSYKKNDKKGYTLEAMPQVEYQRLPGHAQTHISGARGSGAQPQEYRRLHPA